MKSRALLQLILMMVLLQSAAMPARAAHDCQSMDMTSYSSSEFNRQISSAHAGHMAMHSEASPDDISQLCECEDCVCPQGQCHSSGFVMHLDQSQSLKFAPAHHLNQHIYVVLPRILTPDLRPPIIS